MQCGQYVIPLSEPWIQIPSQAGDRPGTVVAIYQNSFSAGTVIGYPISEEELMPFPQPELLAGIRLYLSQNQGIIAVHSGRTPSGLPFLYSIVKNVERNGPVSTVNYLLTVQILLDQFYEFRGQFVTEGVSGIRESVVMNQVMASLPAGKSMADVEWAKDPYDSRATGVLMNHSENERYDASFPEHALSMLRAFLSNSICAASAQF